MSKLQLILLGRFECLLSSGSRVSLSMRKAEVLLAFLALTPGLRHPRERLINLLWSDRGEEQARNSLRQCLSAIRKALGKAAELVLQIDRTTVCLNAAMIEVDVHEFERLAAEGDYESLVTATGLYQGEFLDGTSIRDAACQEWLDSERGRFRRQFIEILSNLAETQLLSHDFTHAIRSAERLVEQDPLGESGWRLLMRGYFDNGDRSHALQAFKRCQQALRDELQVEPEAATLELRAQIATGETSATPVPAPDIGKSPAETRSSDDHSIAVLPFDNLSGDPEQEYFSDGITDSIILNLSLFPGLQVKSRNSSFAFKQQLKNLGEISSELNVDYIVEGSIRKSDQRIRITVQLIEAASGNQIWGKRYDADLADLFTLEEELSRAIAVTVTGQIESDLQRIAIAKGAAGQEAYDLLLSGTYHGQRFNRQDTVIAIKKLNQCLTQDPDNVRAHVMIYGYHSMDYVGRWTEDYQASFRLAEKHIRKALELDPGSGLVQAYYGEFLIFKGELEEATKHIDKALEINPNDPDAYAIRALNLHLRCDFEGALGAAELAISLDPYHPWAEWELAGAQLMCGRYQDALETIEKFRTSPGFVYIYVVSAYIKLGQSDRARQALQEYLQECREDMLSMPQTLDEWLQYTREGYPFVDESINSDLIDCLVQAGLEDGLKLTTSTAEPSDIASIAVLPFENMSGDPEQEYFSDGITASVILSLGLFEGLTVKSQKSSFAYKESRLSSAEIAAALKADYLVEGSIRKSARKVRVSVQLIEASSDKQIWGKQYDAELEDILDLEQELSQAIAATLSGRIGHEIQQSAVRKPAKDLKSYDYLMRGLYHIGKFSAEDMAIAREQIQKCLDIDPDNSIAHTNLAVAHGMELLENWADDRKLAEEKTFEHFETALHLDPQNAQAHAFLADFLAFKGNYDEAEFHADRAIELNPNASEGYAAKADLLNYCRRSQEALKYADLCLQLDPHSVGAGWVAGDVYRNAGQFEKAIRIFRSISHPPPSVHALIATCFFAMELLDEARAEMKRYQKLVRQQMRRYPQSEAEWRQVWSDSTFYRFDDDFEAFFQQLLGAGLCEGQIESIDSQVDIPSIAVLPFENMSGDPEQEYFSDGITTDIIATLSKFKHMRTISRYSTLKYKQENAAIADIAAQQGVRYILEGSVRKSGGRIRVNAELIDSVGEQILWNERYDRDLDDLFAVQDEITKNIALAMKVRFDDGEMALHRSRGANDIRAWELIMTAVDLQDTYIRQNILDARAMANDAIGRDPDYAYAWVSLAWTLWQEAYSGWSESIDDLINEAEKANRQALQLDPEYGETWSQAGMNHIMKHEPEKAIEACCKAVDLEPGNAEVQALAAFAYVFNGDYDKGTHHYQSMFELCPIRPNWYYLIGAQLEKMSGNLDRCAEIYQQAIDVEPDSPLCRFYLIDVMCEKGDHGSARRLANEIRALDKAVTGRGLVQAYSYDRALRDRFRANLEKFDLL